MKIKSTLREIAFNALCKIILNKGYSNLILKNMLKDEEISQLDKNLITEITYGTLKYKYTIDVILKDYIKFNKVDKKILIILEMAIYQLKYLDKIPDYAVLNESVELSKSLNSSFGSFVNAVLRNYLRKKDEFNIARLNDIEKLCFEYSFPENLVKIIMKQYGENAASILKSLNEMQYTTLRINNLKINSDEFIENLKLQGIDFQVSKFSNKFVIIKQGLNIEKMQMYLDGTASIQNESSMFPVNLLDLRKHEHILDICAAPGGKSCYIAETLDDDAFITSCDIHEHRIKLIENNCKRLGIKSISTRALDGTILESSFLNKFDRVIADVPCSGIGVIRKKPEIKYSKIDFDKLIHTQKRILKNGSLYLKNGGTIIYSTCTLNKSENEGVIDWFLKNNKGFSLQKIDMGEDSNFIYDAKDKGVTILPKNNLDGFYISKIKKNEV
ncbi:MAG: 16S rRNA (cytosine(967)-C(5))-methyltransferase RsmB [Oscillospiraceae bacterium]|nr:16S rRNA (cytosine(967)-C(5))-methyltransferase RsmB [Oscillospiraceae bacterium]